VGNSIYLQSLPGSAHWSVAAGSAVELRNTQITVNETTGILTGAGTAAFVGNNIDGLIRNPGGGTFKTLTASFTGALRITLPVFFTNTMIKLTVEIFEYSSGLSCSLSIAGYNATAGGIWYNTTANVVGGNTEYPVYFGHDGSKAVIWIGDTTETWSYPQVQISNVMVSYDNYTKGMWETGWVINFSSAARTNVTATVLDSYPAADWTKNSKRPANLAALAGSENIKNTDITISGGAIAGIGTGNSTPIANSLISIASNGTLAGGGGGQVTIAGLGYTGALNATSNAVTQSGSNPSGGSSGALHYNTSTKRWWTNIGGSWTDNQIEAVSVTAAWIYAGTINVNQLNAGTLTSHTIDTSGYGRFRGGVSVDGYQAAIVANENSTQFAGIYSKGSMYGTVGVSSNSSGAGIYGGNGGSGSGVFGGSSSGPGVRGSSTSGYGGSFSSTNNYGVYATSGGYGAYFLGNGGVYAVSNNSLASVRGINNNSSGVAIRGDTSVAGSTTIWAQNSAGSGYNVGLYAACSYGPAIYCAGTMTITTSSLVSNLNAQFLNGVGTDGYLRYCTTNSGSASVAGGYINFNCTISGYRFSGFANQVTLEAVSDERLKEDIWPEIFGKEFIQSLNPVSYRYKATPKIRHHGFIANRMVEYTGDFNDSLSLYHENSNTYGTDYISYIGPIVKSLKETWEEVDELRKEIVELKLLVQQLLNN
jgi:hypothetical protein